MGFYCDPGAQSFLNSLNSEIYIDKSQLIAFTNTKVNTQQCYLCVSRPRRFGKSMAASMLAAYYGSGEDTAALFAGAKIQQDASFSKHLNQYHVIKVDMQGFMTKTSSVADMLQLMTAELIYDFEELYPDLRVRRRDDLFSWCSSIYHHAKKQFVFLIDEWDCILRRQDPKEQQQEYLDFLRNLLKDQPYVALAYITGILPIRNYSIQSSLNMFDDYSMTDSAQISDCFGFTEAEVSALCQRYGMDFAGAREWYDGYRLRCYAPGMAEEYSIYTPKSIVSAMQRGLYDAYWNRTESFEALKRPIEVNLAGLKDDIVTMLAGAPVPLDIGLYNTDLGAADSKDGILTLLIYLGYLSYNQETKTASIPNKEVATEFVRSIGESAAYTEVARALQASQALLEAIWAQDGPAVAAGIQQAHQEISILQYNSENALSCTIGLALYAARAYYTQIRELPTGKGFADIVFLPRPNHQDKPALLVELKWAQSAQAAIAQIQERNYPAALQDYRGKLLLAGISYDPKSKTHSCSIVPWDCQG